MYPPAPPVEIVTQLPIYAATPIQVGPVAVNTSTAVLEPSIVSGVVKVEPGTTCTSYVLPAARVTTTVSPVDAPSGGSVMVTTRVVATTLTVTLPERIV